jgi:hypothetical protein
VGASATTLGAPLTDQRSVAPDSVSTSNSSLSMAMAAVRLSWLMTTGVQAITVR